MDPIETKTNQSKSTWTLLVLTNILTALIVGSIFYFTDIPNGKALHYADQIRQDYASQITALTKNPLAQFNNPGVLVPNPFSPVNVTKLVFTPQQYINFKNGTVHYSITGIQYGSYALKAPPISYDSSAHYQVGQTVTAVDFKLNVLNDSTGCAEVPQVRRIDDSGSVIGPNIRQFIFQDTGGCASQSDVTYSNLDMPFIVPDSQTEFTFSIQQQTISGDQQIKELKFKIENNSIVVE